jgi:PAS domain-containing protein
VGFSHYVAKDYQNEYYLFIRQCFETEKKQTLELKLFKKGGNSFYAKLDCIPIKGRNDGIDQIRITITDINDLKLAEEALKDSEEKFRLIAETATDFIYQVDMEGIITYCSPAIERILGYKPQEIIGKNFVNYISPANISETMANFRAVVSGKKTDAVELPGHNRARAP